MAEWSKLAEQPNAQVRVASLIGTEAQQDAGMPVRLALSNFADTRMAAAEPVSEPVAVLASADPARSEAHTSELQSLMRISYAVFCLKKNNTHHNLIDNI